jgi:predicted small metal-binding protein
MFNNVAKPEYSNSNSAERELYYSLIIYLNSISHYNFTMLSVSCREVGVDCDYVGKGETENDLMDNLIEHAIKDHGYTREDVLKPEMQEKIKAHIHKS